MRIPTTKILIAACAVIACGAQAQTRQTQQKNLERFEKYAKAPVDQFQFWSLYKWQLVGPTKVVVWPTINQAYLVTVAEPCPGLEWSNSIAVTSKQSHFVTSKFDYVKYARDKQCEIEQIQPIDYRQMLKDGPPPETPDNGKH